MSYADFTNITPFERLSSTIVSILVRWHVNNTDSYHSLFKGGGRPRASSSSQSSPSSSSSSSSRELLQYDTFDVYLTDAESGGPNKGGVYVAKLSLFDAPTSPSPPFAVSSSSSSTTSNLASSTNTSNNTVSASSIGDALGLGQFIIFSVSPSALLPSLLSLPVLQSALCAALHACSCSLPALAVPDDVDPSRHVISSLLPLTRGRFVAFPFECCGLGGIDLWDLTECVASSSETKQASADKSERPVSPSSQLHSPLSVALPTTDPLPLLLVFFATFMSESAPHADAIDAATIKQKLRRTYHLSLSASGGGASATTFKKLIEMSWRKPLLQCFRPSAATPPAVASSSSSSVLAAVKRLTPPMPRHSSSFVPLWGAIEDPLTSVHLLMTYGRLRSVTPPSLSLSPLSPSQPVPTLDLRCNFRQHSPSRTLSTTVRCLLAAYVRSLTLDRSLLLSSLCRPSVVGAFGDKLGEEAARRSENMAEATRALVDAMDFKNATPDKHVLEETVKEIFNRGGGGSEETTAGVSELPFLAGSCPPGSLLSVMSHRIASMKSLTSMAHLYHAIVQFIRDEWEERRLLPNVGVGSDKIGHDGTMCLLGQKIALYNFAVEETRRWEEAAKRSGSSGDAEEGSDAEIPAPVYSSPKKTLLQVSAASYLTSSEEAGTSSTSAEMSEPSQQPLPPLPPSSPPPATPLAVPSSPLAAGAFLLDPIMAAPILHLQHPAYANMSAGELTDLVAHQIVTASDTELSARRDKARSAFLADRDSLILKIAARKGLFVVASTKSATDELFEEEVASPRAPLLEAPVACLPKIPEMSVTVSPLFETTTPTTPTKKHGHSLASPGKGARGPVPGQSLSASKAPMYDPILRDPCPTTSDVELQRQQIMNFVEADGGHRGYKNSIESPVDIARRIALPKLKSDMKAFMSANIGCVFDDYLRWVDWHGSTSSLFDRGLLLTTWSECSPQCAEEQEPLFDAVQEGEKVLHWLETLSPTMLMNQLLCSMLGTSFFVLSNVEGCESSVLVKNALDNVCRAITKVLANLGECVLESISSASNSAEVTEDVLLECEKVCDMIGDVELLLGRVLSCSNKFGACVGIVTDGGEAQIVDGNNMSNVMAFFEKEAKGKTPAIAEYIVEGTSANNVVGRLYAKLESNRGDKSFFAMSKTIVNKP